MQVSVWEKQTFYKKQDVIIIGSGFVGLWSAFYLKKLQPHLKISILERGLIPTGASTRNAGFACFGSLSEVAYDAKMMGTDKMLQLVEMRFEGLNRIQKYFGKDVIDFEMCGGYELYGQEENVSPTLLQENISYINSLLKPITGSKKTYQLEDSSIKTFGFGNTGHMVKNKMEGYLHSGKLVQGLLRAVQSMGVQIFNATEVQRFERVADFFQVHTNHTETFTASQLLLCTNAFTKALFPQIDIVPARGQVILTSPIPSLLWKGTFHSDEGYYYFRNLGNRVLLGGARNKAFEDEATTAMTTSDFIQSELERYLDEVILPQQKGNYVIEHRWAGIMAMGSEKMPIVEEIERGVFCAVRMSGMGVALAPVVGKKISRMMRN